MIELNTAWPSLLGAFALIVGSIVWLLKHENNEEMEELKANTKEIKRLLLILTEEKDDESGNKT